MIDHIVHTSLFRAKAAVLRWTGSIESKVSMRLKAGEGKSLNISATHRLYGCRGLNTVEWGNFALLQYSSDGEPHSLKILCNCSTYKVDKFNSYLPFTRFFYFFLKKKAYHKNAYFENIKIKTNLYNCANQHMDRR